MLCSLFLFYFKYLKAKTNVADTNEWILGASKNDIIRMCIFKQQSILFRVCQNTLQVNTHIDICKCYFLKKKKIYLERHLIVYGYCHNSDVTINTWSDCWVFSVALLGKKKNPFTLITSFSQVKIRNIWQNFFFLSGIWFFERLAIMFRYDIQLFKQNAL